MACQHQLITGTVIGVSFQSSTITATSALGQSFVETRTRCPEPNQPSIHIATVPEGGDITIPQGRL
jgi:hypothetical protein